MSRTLALLLSLPLTACGLFRHVDVEPLATAAQRPANVAAYVAVTDGETPLTELNTGNFRVYEDDQLVPADQTQLTLLDPTLVAAHQVVLLVDMSGATTPQAKSVIAKAAQGFVQKVTPREAVSVFAFDGGAQLVPIAALPRGDAQVTMAALESYTARDPSRNLHGAVVAGLKKLDLALAQSGKIIRVGTLVVFAGGPDIAGRVDSDKAHDAVWESPYDVIGVGVAEQADAVEHVARHGLIRAQAPDTLPIAFEEAADKTIAELDKHYVVSYCSPARAGARRLRLEVTYTNKEGEEHHGDFEMDFDAKGFGPGCNSQSVPRFTLRPVEKPEPAPEASKLKGDGKKQPSGPTDSRDQDRGEDAPVAPPDQPGYAK
ncbi:MAG: hypothetical protein EOO73_35645 [Myxococcales bacterium]|nr:MAG: hypothetical protein EOO73_35645 [Myxococcales bacterium]